MEQEGMMREKLKIQVFAEINFMDLETVFDDGRKYVKLKSRDEPYEVDENTYERVLKWIEDVNAERDKVKSCPFCGGGALYEAYHNVDGFDMPFMFCDWCKAMFTVEGSEDWVRGEDHDGMRELRVAWNKRRNYTYKTKKVSA